MCAVRLAQFFLEFVTESIGIGFLIIKTYAYRLGSIFRSIAVRFGQLDLIGLVGFNISLDTYYSVFTCFTIKKKLKKKKNKKKTKRGILLLIGLVRLI